MMSIRSIIKKLIDYEDLEQPVFVYLYERDEHGCVIKKTQYPVSAVFEWGNGCAKICIEHSQGEES